MLFRVLLAVPQTALSGSIQKWLALPDVMVQPVNLRNGAWKRLNAMNGDCIIVDRVSVPDPIDQSIARLRQLPDAPAVVVLSERENAQERARFLAAGCDAVLNSTLPADTLHETLRAVLHRIRLRAADSLAQRRLTARPRLADFVSQSPAMQAFLRVVARVVHTDAALLIEGPTGVGKERLARAIHAEGSRSAGPFIAVNCGALPESLLESELFGHEQGAFTGATHARRGCFELAHRGTLFLDEIAEMPFHLQVKLLRVLQDYEIQPVGAEKPVKVDVRVMAATNRDIEEEVTLGRFRQDLYYRLNVVTLTIPALRERREDIPALVQQYVDFLRPRIGNGSYTVSPGALEALCRYSWPGNVRELINVIERAMLLCSRGQITTDDLPESVCGRATVGNGTERAGSVAVPGVGSIDGLCDKRWHEVREIVLNLAEREYLAKLLASTRGCIGETARRAGLQPRSLFDKMKKHGLHKEDYKTGPTHARGAPIRGI
jgi:DNA-binding NtrC family response regulator